MFCPKDRADLRVYSVYCILFSTYVCIWVQTPERVFFPADTGKDPSFPRFTGKFPFQWTCCTTVFEISPGFGHCVRRRLQPRRKCHQLQESGRCMHQQMIDYTEDGTTSCYIRNGKWLGVVRKRDWESEGEDGGMRGGEGKREIEEEGR